MTIPTSGDPTFVIEEDHGYLHETLAEAVNALGAVEINMAQYGIKTSGNPADAGVNSTAIALALAALPANGGRLRFPAGSTPINAEITLGDGSAALYSTKRHISVVGAGNGHTFAELTSTSSATTFFWYGAAGGTMVRVKGPISGVLLEGFGLDGLPSGQVNAAASGLVVEHAMDSTFRRITVQNFSDVGVDVAAYPAPNGAANGCDDNVWDAVSVQWPTTNTATCIRIGGTDYGASPHLDVARNLFLGCHFRCVNAGGNAGTAIHFRFCDAITMVSCIATGTRYVEVTVPTGAAGADNFPSSVTLVHPFLIGGNPVVNGTWNGFQPIRLIDVHTGDGWTVPTQNIFSGITNQGMWFDNKLGYQTVRAGSGLTAEVRLSRAGTNSVGMMSDADGVFKVWDYPNNLDMLTLSNGLARMKAKSGVNPEFRLNRNGTDAFGLFSGAGGFLQGWDYLNGLEAFRFASSHLKLKGSASRSTTEPTAALTMFDGTAPVGTLANGVTLYSAAGECRVMDAAGNSTLLSPHDDDGRWVFDSVDTTTGRHLRIDVEKLLRFVDDHFGLGCVAETVGEAPHGG